MRWLPWLLLFSTQMLSAQASVDSINLVAAHEWLERKLTYNYFDGDNQLWWVNRCFISPDGEVRIKNISTNDPLEVERRKFHERIFRFEDINYRELSIQAIEESSGRFVRGHVLRLPGFEDKAEIKTRIQRRGGSRMGFVLLSVPAYFEDSVSGYAEEILAKIAATSRLASIRKVQKIQEESQFDLTGIFQGHFVDSLQGGNWMFERVTPGYHRFKQEDKYPFRGTLAFDREKKAWNGQFFYNDQVISGWFEFSKGIDQTSLNLSLHKSLVVKCIDWQTLEISWGSNRWVLHRK